MSISPNVPSPQESYHYEGGGTPRWITILFAVVIAGVAAMAYAGYSAQTHLQQEVTKAQDQNKILTAQLDQANSRLAELKGQMDVTSQKIGMTQAELADARSRAESIRKAQTASDQKLSEKIAQAQKEIDAHGSGSDQIEVGSRHRRHGRDERLDRAQPRRPGGAEAARRPKLLRIYGAKGQDAATCWTRADVAEQGGHEEIQVHDDSAG